MWPGDALPNSYFGLLRRLVDACPRLEVIKRSLCIEGARMAFARVKVHWAKMDAEKLVKEGLPCYLLSTVLDFPGEEGMMQQSSVSISLSF